MDETVVLDSLSAAVRDVLETMFFLSPAGERDGFGAEAGIEMVMPFQGRPPGGFSLRIATRSAQIAAANFLALESEAPSGTEVDDVAAEMANMICGAVLSRLERTATFEIGQAERGTLDASPGTISQTFAVEDGEIAAAIRFGE